MALDPEQRREIDDILREAGHIDCRWIDPYF